MSNYTSSLEAVYAIRDNASPAPQNENRLVAYLSSQFRITRGGLILNGTLLAIIVILAIAEIAVLGFTDIALGPVSTEAPAVWMSEDGYTYYGESEVIIGSSLQGGE